MTQTLYMCMCYIVHYVICISGLDVTHLSEALLPGMTYLRQLPERQPRKIQNCVFKKHKRQALTDIVCVGAPKTERHRHISVELMCAIRRIDIVPV